MKFFRGAQVALCMAVAFTPAAWSQQAGTAQSGLHTMTDEYLTGIARGFWQARAYQVEKIETTAQVARRRDLVRRTYLGLLGHFPERTPMHATVTGTFDRPGYQVRNVLYQSRPGFYVTANLYLPAGAGPFPGVLGTAGHSAAGKADGTYQNVWITLAKAGFVVLAFDEVGLGERVQYLDTSTGRSKIGIASAEHTVMGMQSLLVGDNLGMYVSWDAIRGVDYLSSLPEVDAHRIAVIGNSGGGHQTAIMALLDQRLRVAAPSCWLTSSEELWEHFQPQDAEQNVAGFLSHGLDYGDFALAFAPKPFLFATATRDFFPIAGAHATFAEDKRIYEVLGHPERLDLFEFDDTHGWSQPRREATYAWLEHWLMRSVTTPSEPSIVPEQEAALFATKTGQVSTAAPESKTVPMLTAARAAELALSRPHLSAERLRPLLRRQLGIEDSLKKNVSAPTVEVKSTEERGTFQIQHLLIGTERGITLPALLYLPKNRNGRTAVVVLISSAGKDSPSVLTRAEDVVRTGKIVLAPDLRGWGETAPLGGKAPHTGLYETAMRAFLVGKTLVGMQVFDLARCIDYLVGIPGIDSHHLAVEGYREGGSVALFAAALDFRIGSVTSESSLVSFDNFARSPVYDQALFEDVVPHALEHFDLPDVAASIAPRPLSLVNMETATGARLSGRQAEDAYAVTVHAYRVAGKAAHLRFQVSAPSLDSTR